jgi:hypothetical protein
MLKDNFLFCTNGAIARAKNPAGVEWMRSAGEG